MRPPVTTLRRRRNSALRASESPFEIAQHEFSDLAPVQLLALQQLCSNTLNLLPGELDERSGQGLAELTDCVGVLGINCDFFRLVLSVEHILSREVKCAAQPMYTSSERRFPNLMVRCRRGTRSGIESQRLNLSQSGR